jgi:hypothetical protein
MNIDFLDKKTFTLFLSSNDKVSGTNHQATFNINWASFLPQDYTTFKVVYSFQTAGGYYVDTTGTSNFNNCKIVIDFGCRSYSYDSSTNAPSQVLGFAQRDIQTTATSSNSFTTFFYQFPAKTINRPTQNSVVVSIYNTSLQNGLNNQLLVNTNAAGVLQADMTAWTMALEFIPVETSKISDQKAYSV